MNQYKEQFNKVYHEMLNSIKDDLDKEENELLESMWASVQDNRDFLKAIFFIELKPLVMRFKIFMLELHGIKKTDIN